MSGQTYQHNFRSGPAEKHDQGLSANPQASPALVRKSEARRGLAERAERIEKKVGPAFRSGEQMK